MEGISPMLYWITKLIFVMLREMQNFILSILLLGEITFSISKPARNNLCFLENIQRKSLWFFSIDGFIF